MRRPIGLTLGLTFRLAFDLTFDLAFSLRLGLTFGLARRAVALVALATVTFAFVALAMATFRRLFGLRRNGIARKRRGCADDGNRLAGQLLDRHHRLAVHRRDQRDRGAQQTGAAGAADAVNVIIGMVRNVEIEDVADGRNVEAAGGDVGGDQKLGFAATEGFQRRGARRLVEIAVQRHGVELMPLQRLM